MMAWPASIAMTLPLTTDPSAGVSISKLSFKSASNSSIVLAMWQFFPNLAFFTGRAVVSAGL